MFSCNICSKSFKTYKARNAHMISHKETSRYKEVRKVNRPTLKITSYFLCLNCDNKTEVKDNTYNKYCSIQCSADHRAKLGYQAWLNGEIPTTKVHLKKYLTNKYGYKCSTCEISDWFNQKLSLEIDHIDGNSENNNLENVRFLCPNCHSQTPTFKGRNIGRYKINNASVSSSASTRPIK